MISEALDDSNQRENLFLTMYLIKENVGSLIIYSGSYAIIASFTKVDFLEIPITKRYSP